MKKVLVYASALLMLAGLPGCAESSAGGSDEPVSVSVSVSEAEVFGEDKGCESYDDAYRGFVDAIVSGDGEKVYELFSPEEITAVRSMTQEQTGYDDDTYRSVMKSYEKEQFIENMNDCISDLRQNMDLNGGADAEWETVYGTVLHMSEDEIGIYAEKFSLDIEDAMYSDNFFVENESANASLSGIRAVLWNIGGKWYPSFIYTANNLRYTYQE